MIEKFSIWTKNLTLAIVVVSIIEMLIPNNKTKKYIKVVMGIYILFNIISPFLSQDISLDVGKILESTKVEASATVTEKVDQTSMDNKLKEICKEEIEKDISKKIEQLGYEVKSCKVEIEIQTMKKIEGTSKIKKIYLDVEKKENIDVKKEENMEDKLINEIDKIKEIQIGGKKEESKIQDSETKKLTLADIQNIKKILIKEYEVNEKCLKIN